jgi:hypothetical protein
VDGLREHARDLQSPARRQGQEKGGDEESGQRGEHDEEEIVAFMDRGVAHGEREGEEDAAAPVDAEAARNDFHKLSAFSGPLSAAKS